MANHSAGMCRNPFGGKDRLDKCNLQGPSLLAGMIVDVASGVPSERTMIAEIFREALFNYLYFGLGQNGTTAPEFFFSSEFLLRVRSTQPETWTGARLMRDTYKDEATGKRVTRVIALSDEELKSMCADYMWSLGEWPIPFETFITALRAERRRLLERNREQVQQFIDLMRNRSLSRRVLLGETISVPLLSRDMLDILTDPTDPDDLSELIGHQPRRRSRASVSLETRCTRSRRRHCNPTPASTPATGDLLACLEEFVVQPSDVVECRAAGMPA